MPKGANQKMKILYLMQLFLEETDEEHPLTMQQIMTSLKKQGIQAERKSIYSDLEALRTFGMEIEKTSARQCGYYLAERTFQLPELKLLVDAVQSSRFITAQKSRELIRKVESLASIHQAKDLQRQVRVTNRIKTMNESIYYNVDAIHEAISREKQVDFLYFEWVPGKKGRLERKYRHSGSRYFVSPWALTWDDENYYLIAYDSRAACIKHFRVDKMSSIRVREEERDGKDSFEKMDMAAYTEKLFGMFGGEDDLVTLRFSESLAGVVADRFGKDIRIFQVENGFFEIHVHVAVSPLFFGWLFGFGEKAELIGPSRVREEYTEYLRQVAAFYGLLPAENEDFSAKTGSIREQKEE